MRFNVIELIGTAIAGKSYTTACSPNKIVFPGVEIEIAPELTEKHYFTFKLKTESLRETLMLLSQIAPIDYTINGKDVKISLSNE